MVERWSKLSDQQLKLSATPGGIKFANQQVAEASDVQLRGKGEGFLESALEQAEQARSELLDENLVMRGQMFSFANELQRLAHFGTKDEVRHSLYPILCC